MTAHNVEQNGRSEPDDVHWLERGQIVISLIQEIYLALLVKVSYTSRVK